MGVMSGMILAMSLGSEKEGFLCVGNGSVALLDFIYSGLGLGVMWVPWDGAGRGRVYFVMVLRMLIALCS
jgi:hypothetical protein